MGVLPTSSVPTVAAVSIATAGTIAYATAYVGASGNGPAAATAGARAYYGKAARTAAAVAYATDPAVDLTVGEIAVQTDVAGATATAAAGAATATYTAAYAIGAARATDAAAYGATATPAGGNNTTYSTPTAPPSNSTLNVCTFAHYDSAHYTCLQDDTSVGISDNSVEVTFPNETSDSKIMAYTLNIRGGGVRQAAQKLIDIETGTGYSPACNDDIELQEVDLDGKVMGAAPLHIVCT